MTSSCDTTLGGATCLRFPGKFQPTGILQPGEQSDIYNFYIYSRLCFSLDDGQRAIGCPGLDTPFKQWPYRWAVIGQVSPIVTILTSDWLPRNSGSPIYHSPAMQCGRQTYKNLADIVEKFASDQQYWSGNSINFTFTTAMEFAITLCKDT